MSCCSTVFFGTNGMALARRLALRRSGFAWRFKDGSAPTARLSCLISDPCGFDAGDLSRGGRTAGVPPQARRPYNTRSWRAHGPCALARRLAILRERFVCALMESHSRERDGA
jgi:hypothetical protein